MGNFLDFDVKKGQEIRLTWCFFFLFFCDFLEAPQAPDKCQDLWSGSGPLFLRHWDASKRFRAGLWS